MYLSFLEDYDSFPAGTHIILIYMSVAYSEPCQTSKMECFEKIVDG